MRKFSPNTYTHWIRPPRGWPVPDREKGPSQRASGAPEGLAFPFHKPKPFQNANNPARGIEPVWVTSLQACFFQKSGQRPGRKIVKVPLGSNVVPLCPQTASLSTIDISSLIIEKSTRPEYACHFKK